MISSLCVLITVTVEVDIDFFVAVAVVVVIGVAEVQSLVCRATNGSFTLSFRGSKSAKIAYNSTVAALKTQIETIPK